MFEPRVPKSRPTLIVDPHGRPIIAPPDPAADLGGLAAYPSYVGLPGPLGRGRVVSALRVGDTRRL